MSRKLASIRKIDRIDSIPGADQIEVATIGGWKVVVKRDEFQPNDLAVYCEVDSWIPHELAPFLSKDKEPREYNGVKGERLRTIKLRGQTSQGLLLPLNELLKMKYDGDSVVGEGDDVTEMLGIQKWEAPVPANLVGMAKGLFPTFIKKTDQERVQNLTSEIAEWHKVGYLFEVSEKLDGSSMTIFFKDDEVGVCSRNLELKEDDSNTFWRVAKAESLIDKLKNLGRNIAIQGELIGEGIQGNKYGIKGQKFYLFDIFDIDSYSYVSPEKRRTLAKMLDINHVPVISGDKDLGTGTVEEILQWAEDKSRLNDRVEREGLVFKLCGDGNISFKSISNKFLLKNGD